ncbi:MAG TPA: hypothetical protein VGG99_17500 [Acetobacteraceae bacterium]|jgi:hypothetical protein
MSNGYYNLDNAEPAKMMNWKIAKDVLRHLEQIVDQCALRKLDKRSDTKQTAYAVAKLFGHVSSHPDLYLWHSSIGPNTLFFQGDECIRALDVDGVRLCYRIWLLGKQSKKASNKLQQSAAANEICIHVNKAQSLKQVNVTMDLSGPAMLQLCADLGRRSLLPKIRKMMQVKWGNTGVSFGNIDPNERKAQGLAFNKEDQNPLGGVLDGGEAYIYRRYLNGIVINWDDGKGWIV